MTLRLSPEVKNSLLESISRVSPIKHVDDKTYLSITKIELSAEGLTLLYDDLPIFQLRAILDPKRDVLTVTGLDALFGIRLD